MRTCALTVRQASLLAQLLAGGCFPTHALAEVEGCGSVAMSNLKV